MCCLVARSSSERESSRPVLEQCHDFQQRYCEKVTECALTTDREDVQDSCACARVSFAQLQCENASDQLVTQRIASDAHSPAKFRVNGVLRNLPEFAQTFSCRAGAELAPTDRCQIW